MLQSRKRLKIFFKNLEFHAFRSSGWWLVRRWKVQSRGVHRDFRGSVRDSFTSGTSSRKKNIEIFLESFLSSVLVAGPGDLHAIWFSRENRVFCTKWVNFWTFSVFPSNFHDCSLSSPFQTSFKLIVSLSKNLHFYIISTSFFKKRYGFSYYLIVFHVYSMCFLDFCVVVWVLWHMLFTYGMGLLY